MTWSVWQTGGRRHTYWFVVFAGAEAEAREWFARLKANLSRGGLQLRDPDGKVVETHTVSKVRAR